MLYLWFSIYRQGGKLGNYSIAGIVLYYAFSKLITLVIQSQDIGRVIGDSIREGEIVSYLIKPINFKLKELFNTLGKSVFRFIIYSPIFLFILIAEAHYASLSYINIIYFFIALGVGFVIYYLTFYIVGISTFFLGFIMGLNFLMGTIINFLSGYLAPLDLFPAYIFKILEVLPFKFIMYVPISIIQGKMKPIEVWQNYLIGCVWIIVLFFISNYLYKKGLEKYEAFGS
jgi:ABC-2 type transport system permease protein